MLSCRRSSGRSTGAGQTEEKAACSRSWPCSRHLILPADSCFGFFTAFWVWHTLPWHINDKVNHTPCRRWNRVVSAADAGHDWTSFCTINKTTCCMRGIVSWDFGRIFIKLDRSAFYYNFNCAAQRWSTTFQKQQKSVAVLPCARHAYENRLRCRIICKVQRLKEKLDFLWLQFGAIGRILRDPCSLTHVVFVRNTPHLSHPTLRKAV